MALLGQGDARQAAGQETSRRRPSPPSSSSPATERPLALARGHTLARDSRRLEPGRASRAGSGGTWFQFPGRAGASAQRTGREGGAATQRPSPERPSVPDPRQSRLRPGPQGKPEVPVPPGATVPAAGQGPPPPGARPVVLQGARLPGRSRPPPPPRSRGRLPAPGAARGGPAPRTPPSAPQTRPRSRAGTGPEREATSAQTHETRTGRLSVRDPTASPRPGATVGENLGAAPSARTRRAPNPGGDGAVVRRRATLTTDTEGDARGRGTVCARGSAGKHPRSPQPSTQPAVAPHAQTAAQPCAGVDAGGPAGPSGGARAPTPAAAPGPQTVGGAPGTESAGADTAAGRGASEPREGGPGPAGGHGNPGVRTARASWGPETAHPLASPRPGAFSPSAPAAGPENAGVLSVWTRPHVLHSRPVGVDAAPRPPQQVLSVWTRPHVLHSRSCRCGRDPMSSTSGPVDVDATPRPPQRVLSVWTRPHVLYSRSCWCRHGPMSSTVGPVSVDAAPHPPEASTVGPEETRLLLVWKRTHNPSKPPQQVPSWYMGATPCPPEASTAGPVGPVNVGAAPGPPEASTAGPEEAGLLSQLRLRRPGSGREVGSGALCRWWRAVQD
ncbi:collagen alpha-1(I) chain-like [Meles meles]|uniref:collagen alpha-1(I) chain-like n=1 Tax=Meles meles TaxID=9662 RepID=UPI001E69F76A|nr:collagen alpha-1(I) chain-like [Meles meles]